ncbi:hypothetical protein KO481_38400 [Nocardia sp. NEAU-G5]|uniref:Uncharacterized protein n=1 Tax=Nocardia albiluteola TaxID=2842303 RepID=A0ABS6BCA4_9NOCA|nr:DUF6461 domain-containing protein [Nocardia albiluteola]MBU3067381.1 hypothetical protein [Nocardia albiluteola]
MAVPGFPPNTLDEEGVPLWISGLVDEDPNYSVHVVRGLDPADALEALGAKLRLFRPWQLPDTLDDWTWLSAAPHGIDLDEYSTLLLAGRVGEWTFVYDDFMATMDDQTPVLAAAGRVAATSTMSINTDASLTYCVDGENLAWINVDDLELDRGLPAMPDELRAAFEAAGTFDLDYLEPGEADYSIGMRAVSALANLRCTLADLRGIPLVITPFG